ncbi:MAG: hypothetical protein ACKOQU_11710, partial [Acidimicrobiaceae bacterium]
CLPIIAHRSITDLQLSELRNALSESTRVEKIPYATAAGFIGGFEALELDDSLRLLNLMTN